MSNSEILSSINKICQQDYYILFLLFPTFAPQIKTKNFPTTIFVKLTK